MQPRLKALVLNSILMMNSTSNNEIELMKIHELFHRKMFTYILHTKTCEQHYNTQCQCNL